MLGMDPTNEAYQSKVLKAATEYGGDNVVNVVKDDIQKSIKWFRMENIPKEEVTDAAPFVLNMAVVKMQNGKLLLYAPIRMHQEVPDLLFSWLESLGPVEWLVVASSAHTLCLPDAVKAFPKAKVVGAEATEGKLKYAKVSGCQYEYH